MQAKSRRPRPESTLSGLHTMRSPAQRPPVDRQYMRLVVGRMGKPEPAAEVRKKGRRTHRDEGDHTGGDFLVELTTFHMRRRFRW